MNEVILMSIRPEWLVKILNGEKTVELRKRFPKNYRGWVYLYCTKGKSYLYKDLDSELSGDVVFISNEKCDVPKQLLNGKVVARVWVDNVDVGTKLSDGSGYVYLPQKSLCLTNEEIMQYANNSPSLTVIYFSKLEIFNKPKELGEFSVERYAEMPNGVFPCYEPLTKAPQSWQYVYVDVEK